MRYTPNPNTWIGFVASLTGTLAAPKAADISAAIDLTSKVTNVTASSQGSALPTPAFDTRFEESIAGGVTATFSLEGYRYTLASEDTLWTTLPRDTVGTFIIARSGGKPIVGARVECWPVLVLSRSVPAMAANSPVMVNITCSNPQTPNEDAVVAA